MSLPEILRQAREHAGLSLRALARRCTVDPAYLSRVERGIVPPSEQLLANLSQSLPLALPELLLRAGRIPSEMQRSILTNPAEALAAMTQSLNAAQAPSTQPKNVVAYGGCRALEDEAFPFEWISDIAEAESWRKEIYRPCYHLHKWWAQRLGSVFRAILIGAFSPRGSDVLQMFYEPSRIPRAIVFDPFMGSGTTVGEALKLGMRAIGRDINPVAHEAVNAALTPYNLEDVKSTYHSVLSSIRQKLAPYYLTRLNDGREVEVAYYFWVKYLPCTGCGERVDLFSTYIFSRHAYPKKEPLSRILCPGCGEVSEGRYDATEHRCTACHYCFNPQEGPARRTKAICRSCGDQFSIAATARSYQCPPSERLYAKIVMTENGTRQYLPTTDFDRERYLAAQDMLGQRPDLFPKSKISEGYNTNQVLNYGYRHWYEMFNSRQLLSLGLLGRQISEIQDLELRKLFTMAFSGLLEFHNTFTSFKGEGTGAVRHMFSHHILKPERTPLEANPLSETGSGSFPGLFQRRVVRALEYATDPFEVGVSVTDSGKRVAKKVHALSEPMTTRPVAEYETFAEGRRLYLSTGDSATTDIPTGSVDAVVTDPPFFDNVHYSELADFFHVWQAHLRSDGVDRPITTRSTQEVQHGDGLEFSKRLAGVWQECARVLVPHGLLVFSYHHSRPEGWSSLLRSLSAADFGITAAHPIKSELSLATPKSQARSPVDVDILFCCRRRETVSSSLPTDRGSMIDSAKVTAASQATRFNKAGRLLGRNDLFVLTYAQIIRHLSWENPSTTDAMDNILSDLTSRLEPFVDELLNTQEVAEQPQPPFVFTQAQLSLI
jgi:putative DNA methylase